MPEPGDPGSPEVAPQAPSIEALIIAAIAELARLFPGISIPVLEGVLRRFGDEVAKAFEAWVAEVAKKPEPAPLVPGGVDGDPGDRPPQGGQTIGGGPAYDPGKV
jgi:hypothetical protein